MNREAVILGVPAYSIFRGTTGSVDSVLAKRGDLTFVESSAQISDIRIEKRKRPDDVIDNKQRSAELVSRIVQEIVTAAT